MRDGMYRCLRLAPVCITIGAAVVAGWSCADAPIVAPTKPTPHPMLAVSGVPAARITDLGTLPGGTSSDAVWINNAGEVVGYSTTSSGATHPVLWRDGAIIDLPMPPGATYGQAYGINSEGVVVGAFAEGTAAHAVMWDHGVPTELQPLAGDHTAEAFGINDAGEVVGSSGASANAYGTPVIWNGGVATALAIPNPDRILYGINNRGDVSGSYFLNGVIHGFIWHRGAGYTDLGALGMSGSLAQNGINDVGQVAGVSRTLSGASHAFIWAATTGMVDLGALPGATESFGEGINNRGEVVGTADTPSGAVHPALFWGGNVFDLGVLPGDVYGLALSINDHGQAVGYTVSPGRRHAVLWTTATPQSIMMRSVAPSYP